MLDPHMSIEIGRCADEETAEAVVDAVSEPAIDDDGTVGRAVTATRFNPFGSEPELARQARALQNEIDDLINSRDD